MSTARYLDDILAAHRAQAAADRRDVETLVARARSAGPTRSFRDALVAGPGLAVIAEIKRRSPSKGDLAPGLDPEALSQEYWAGGARALSVLTDAAFFGGSPDDLAAARRACPLPVLRKDFTVGPADVADARLMGADAVLLIAAALGDPELADLVGLARSLGLDALVEVHDEAEAGRAVTAGADIIGVNQRDLRTFAVDRARAARVVRALPAAVVAVAESGVGDGDDARRLADAGFRAVLVGESLLGAGDRRAAVAAMVGHPVGAPVDPAGRA